MVKNKRAPQRASKDKKMKKERKHCVLVCVTSQFRCEDLIFAGADIAHEGGLALKVLSVQPSVQISETAALAIEHLYDVSKTSEAEMSVFYSDDAVGTIVEYAKKAGASHIVLGRPFDQQRSEFIQRLEIYLPNMKFHVVPARQPRQSTCTQLSFQGANFD